MFQESVNQVDCEEEGLWEHFELVVDVDDPIDENSSHFVIDGFLDEYEVV